MARFAALLGAGLVWWWASPFQGFHVIAPAAAPAAKPMDAWNSWAVTGEKDMKVWNSIDNQKFDTFSFLLALSDAEIACQVQMVIRKNLAGLEVLREVAECKAAYPQCYIRSAALGSVKRAQAVSFVVRQPGGSSRYSALVAPPAAKPVGAWNFWVVTSRREMKLWNPINNKRLETFSYLPPLSDVVIAKQIDMVIAKNLAPCLEFSFAEEAYVFSDGIARFSGSGSWEGGRGGCAFLSALLSSGIRPPPPPIRCALRYFSLAATVSP